MPYLNADQILNAIEAEYKYWRDHTDDKNEGVAWQAMGAVGACANLLAVGRGLMRPRLERSVEAAGSDDGLKLLPCPFCGGEPTVCVDSRWLVIGQWAYQQIDCSVCDASMRVEAVTPREIELAWNRRSLAITPPVQKGTQDA